MSGRLELDRNTERKINNRLVEMPQFVIDWYHNMSASGFTVTSCYDYVTVIVRFLKFVNDNTKEITISDINHSNIAAFLTHSQTRRLKDGTVKPSSGSTNQHNWMFLKNLCDFLVSEGKLEKNPMTSIKKPKSNDLDRITRERILLTKEDFDKMLYQIKHYKYDTRDKMGLEIRDYALIILFMSTGIRLSALRSIDLSDIDLNEKKIWFVDKGEIEHVWDLSSICTDALLNWLEIRELYLCENNTNALFISSRGERISESAVEALVRKYSVKAFGHAISPHKLRSGFISVMYDVYGDIEKVRRMVGHKNIATTARYIVTKGTEKKEAANTFDELFGDGTSFSTYDTQNVEQLDFDIIDDFILEDDFE